MYLLTCFAEEQTCEMYSMMPVKGSANSNLGLLRVSSSRWSWGSELWLGGAWAQDGAELAVDS